MRWLNPHPSAPLQRTVASRIVGPDLALWGLRRASILHANPFISTAPVPKNLKGLLPSLGCWAHVWSRKHSQTSTCHNGHHDGHYIPSQAKARGIAPVPIRRQAMMMTVATTTNWSLANSPTQPISRPPPTTPIEDPIAPRQIRRPAPSRPFPSQAIQPSRPEAKPSSSAQEALLGSLEMFRPTRERTPARAPAYGPSSCLSIAVSEAWLA
ncbi:hypothetical protein B0J12DRAFT_9728 [Macrophomina phaseolina]|uniref:Uncharacterized protein n=1 Tax=Macrophomina phaseolina TaxID=35725 RepID=A0ABQ8GX24_9PEZI|nr:hypothetical protein B0J12DRAFT_9728 [Macrophomina phaseolina]